MDDCFLVDQALRNPGLAVGKVAFYRMQGRNSIPGSKSVLSISFRTDLRSEKARFISIKQPIPHPPSLLPLHWSDKTKLRLFYVHDRTNLNRFQDVCVWNTK